MRQLIPPAEGLGGTLLEAAPDAMACMAANGRLVLVNAEAERRFGYERAELIGTEEGILVLAILAGVAASLRLENRGQESS